ncbi:carboxypeptidase-like regulatory domain-containing protein, partial [Klebsiella pneumoniae]|uniref:carboxypeptidase-like regulatory domain-containing protein n=1 Tax=Klebsiella pneumoniae TaxID=573 RepID=UPI0013D32167
IMVNYGKTQSAVSNSNGQFVINNIATGRVTIMVSIIGFKTAVIPEILVTAGKEVIVDIALEQEVKTLADVTVNSSRIKKGNASNEFAG